MPRKRKDEEEEPDFDENDELENEDEFDDEELVNDFEDEEVEPSVLMMTMILA